MLEFENLSGKKNYSKIQNFNLNIKQSQVHVLLSSSTTFIDDLLRILRKDEFFTKGKVEIDGRNLFCEEIYRQVQFLTSDDVLYKDLNVAENLFFSKRDFFILKTKRKDKSIMDRLAAETGFSINLNIKADLLTSEQCKILEILKCYNMKPKFLVASEMSNLLSYKNFSKFIDLLDKMKNEGAYILYLTSQWEEALKVADIITVVSRGENCGTYMINDIRNDPSQIYYLVMGGKRFLEDNKQENDLNMLRKINENIRDISSGYSLNKTLHNFANHLLSELKAENCVVYLVNSVQDRFVDIVAQAKNEYSQEVACLKTEVIWQVIKDERIEFFYKKDANFSECFVMDTNIRTVIAYPIKMSSNAYGLIQLNFNEYQTLTQQDSLLLSWMAKEMAIVIENSKLMGKSMLLQESYHRIKNNLQIIISLIEMEKDSMSPRNSGVCSFEKVDEILSNVIGRVKSIAKMHDLLTSEKISNSMIDMRSIVCEICNFYDKSARIVLEFDKIYVRFSRAVSVALVANELISNSVKHNPDTNVNIKIVAKEDKTGGNIFLRFSDDGCGFVDQTSPEDNSGVGMRVLKAIVRYEFGGELRYYNQNGAAVDIVIPISNFISTERFANESYKLGVDKENGLQ